MVEYDKEGKLICGKLNEEGVLSQEELKNYDYPQMRKDFKMVVERLSMNKILHTLYKNRLNYKVDENLEFKIFVDPDVKDLTITPGYISSTDANILTLDESAYRSSIEMCEQLLIRVKKSWKELNEVERFILKSLEFDVPRSIDEDLKENMNYCKDKYWQFKKSSYVKMAVQLDIANAKPGELDN